MIKEAFYELQNEMIELAEKNEATINEKCAQTIIAATGLGLLRDKLSPMLDSEALQEGED